mgnify:CR=1 FL=1
MISFTLWDIVRHLLMGAGWTILLSAIAFVLGGVLAPATSKMPLLRLMPGAAAKQAEIDALAVRLGELQAKLLRLDGVARQVGAKTGIDVGPFLSDQPVPRGGGHQPAARKPEWRGLPAQPDVPPG